MKVAQNISDLIGNTPIIKLNKIDENLPGNIYVKCEFMNPTSSVKDRIGFNMIHQALLNGNINKNTHIIEPTSGNTGIALASICASLGLKLTLTMPESMSIERQKLIRAFGANIELTPASKGMAGALQKADELEKKETNAIVLQQFENENNPKIHETTTALEILKDMDNNIDIFIAAVGTGGTLSGTGKVLKQTIPNIEIVAVEPMNSAVLSKGQSGLHKIQGIGAGFIPETLDTAIYDDIITVSDNNAITTSKKIALQEGLLVGISSGANIWSAIQLASLEENRDKNIITIACDTGERYISTELFN